LALIPVYIVIYLNAVKTGDARGFFLSAAVLAVSCLTDMLDGMIARHFNMMTTLGKFLDPVADKATQFTLIACLAVRFPVLIYLIALFVLKEGFQLIAGAVKWRKGKILNRALMSGKICTTVLFLSLIFMVLIPTLSEKTVTIITVVDSVFMIISFVHYILAYCGKVKKAFDDRDY
jgi:cardiolipin synthase